MKTKEIDYRKTIILLKKELDPLFDERVKVTEENLLEILEESITYKE
jgi:hypothetical protein